MSHKIMIMLALLRYFGECGHDAGHYRETDTDFLKGAYVKE
jgi:hypothetical protein